MKKLSRALILPKEVRDGMPNNAPIYEEHLQQGIISLVNKGLIPRASDYSPAFHRGHPPLSLKQLFLESRNTLPAQSPVPA